MELRHLRYFLMIAQTENVRRASERLNIAQPAVSRQLQDLEEELGVELFERLPRGLRLNAAGRAYQADVTRILDMLAAAAERARRVSAGEAGFLKLGYLEITAWQGAVPAALQAFTTAHPEIRVELVPANTPRQMALMEKGELDGGFVYPMDTLPEAWAAHLVRSGSVVVAIPVSWSDRVKPDPRLKDLEDFPFVGFPRKENPAYYDRIVEACRASGLSPHLVQEEPNEGAMLSLVSAGIGIAIVNDANLDRPPPLIRFTRVQDLFVPLDLQFVYRRENLNPSLRVFVETLQSNQLRVGKMDMLKG